MKNAAVDTTILSGASAVNSPGTPTPPAHMDCIIYQSLEVKSGTALIESLNSISLL